MSLSFNKHSVKGATSRPTLGEYSPPHSGGQPRLFDHDDYDETRWQHLYVLPVLLLEFLALALTRAALPSMLVNQYGDSVYVVMGFADCVRGLLAFLACPLFGKISDVVGRRVCLFITVLGTCAPVCSLAFFSWETTLEPDGGDPSLLFPSGETGGAESSSLQPDDSPDSGGFWPIIWGNSHNNDNDDDAVVYYADLTHRHTALTTFVVLLALSGVFSSTFTLVFAYISDTVRQQEERVSAYGLALATFGLSFTIGPIAGGYLARSNKHYVFLASLLLTLLDLLYIYVVLPESRPTPPGNVRDRIADYHMEWNPISTLRIIIVDPFLQKVSKVAFLYYTGLWALISTISVYAVKRFHLGPERLGEFMSALGLCTMVAEAVLVRIMVPMFGEKRAMKIGLFSFAIQCVVLGFAYEPWHLFVCAAFSLLGNLVYPSLSSLVSGSVEPAAVGEALGAVNGIKALTEGIGPLVFGSLMTLSENMALPGWPYLLAALLVAAAYQATEELPDPEDDHDYIHELERKRRMATKQNASALQSAFGNSSLVPKAPHPALSPVMQRFRGFFTLPSTLPPQRSLDGDVELEHLLSEIEDDDSGEDEDDAM